MGPPLPRPGDVRVLVVDDEILIRDALAALIERAGMAVVGVAADGSEAVEVFRHRRPDVVLMDLCMPRMDGLEATAAILREFPCARIIVLTAREGDEDIHRALAAGAASYLLKNTTRAQLLDTILQVHGGETRLLPHDVASRLAARTAGQVLTRREAGILQLVAEGNTNKEIAAALRITEGTVKGHINSVLLKLGARHRTHAVMLALHRGIVRLRQ